MFPFSEDSKNSQINYTPLVPKDFGIWFFSVSVCRVVGDKGHYWNVTYSTCLTVFTRLSKCSRISREGKASWSPRGRERGARGALEAAAAGAASGRASVGSDRGLPLAARSSVLWPARSISLGWEAPFYCFLFYFFNLSQNFILAHRLSLEFTLRHIRVNAKYLKVVVGEACDFENKRNPP